MSFRSWQGERGVAGAPGPPGIAGGKVSFWAAPAWTPAVRSGSGPDQKAILVLVLPALFWTISPQIFMDFLLGEGGGGQGWWLRLLWNESAADEGRRTDGGQTGRWGQAEVSSVLERKEEGQRSNN